MIENLFILSLNMFFTILAVKLYHDKVIVPEIADMKDKMIANNTAIRDNIKEVKSQVNKVKSLTGII